MIEKLGEIALNDGEPSEIEKVYPFCERDRMAIQHLTKHERHPASVVTQQLYVKNLGIKPAQPNSR